MKQIRFIYTEKGHKWGVISRDPEKPDYMIDTNECLIINNDEAILTDPGGMEIFPAVFSAISSSFNPKNIRMIFASHQDPDIISSLSLWLEMNPSLKCHISRLWTTFVPHFGGNNETLVGIPDEGCTFTLGDLKLQAIPAHYLHSPGNFHLYDSRAKIYFSGDVGAALLPDVRDIYVKNFDDHIRYAKGFHERWMGYVEARNNWCERISKLDIDMLVPQHGSIYTGKDVERFINWFCDLRIGLYALERKTEETSKNNAPPESASVEEAIAEVPSAQVIAEVPEMPSDPSHLVLDDSDLHALMNSSPEKNGTKSENKYESGAVTEKSEKKSLFSRFIGLFRSK